jgi:DNA polymerase III sliding clamp (beta) subunit (PCNA family)
MAMRAESIELSVATQDVGQAREDIEATYEGTGVERGVQSDLPG